MNHALIINTIAYTKPMLYPKAYWPFAVTILVTWTGFCRSYFSRLPQTHGAHHLHGLSAGLWLGILVAKPMRYQRGRFRLHRQLGWSGGRVLVAALQALRGSLGQLVWLRD